MTKAATLRPASFEKFATLLREGSGLSIGQDKLYLLESRLMPIAKQAGLADLDALAAHVGTTSDPKLRGRIIEAMTTNESFFFRDTRPFVHFKSVALPQLIAARAPQARLRIWSAASSSGQEAYSLAMNVDESRAALGTRQVELLGTDISPEQLNRAREGVYTQFEVQRGLPMQLLVKHFSKDGANWRISDQLKRMVEFREGNLLADLTQFGRFDIIFCRNVLIYFDTPTKARALAALSRQLAPDGLLYLGGAETIFGISDAFVSVPEERGVYRRA